MRVRIERDDDNNFYVTDREDGRDSVIVDPAKVAEWDQIAANFQRMQEELEHLYTHPSPPSQTELQALEDARAQAREQKAIVDRLLRGER